MAAHTKRQTSLETERLLTSVHISDSPALTLTSFGGKALLGTFDVTPVSFTGTPAETVGVASGGTALGFGLTNNFSTYWNTSGLGATGFVDSAYYTGGSFDITTLPEINFGTSLVNAAMNQFETTEPTAPVAGAAGVTAIKLHRVFVQSGRRGIWVH